jgi:uncharacterized protein YggE
MKKLIFAFTALCSSLLSTAQISGNINYEETVHYPEQTINVGATADRNLYINIKGMLNVKPDMLIATFSVTQTGKSAQEAHELMDKRIKTATAAMQALKGAQIYVDMISCVPLYQTQVEQKIFSKKTYNEVPAGFELKKNIQIRLTDPALMDELMAIAAEQEIYDLVKVDYTVLRMEELKKELMAKAQKLVLEKIKFQETLLGISLTGTDRTYNDGFKVFLPTEMYKRYTAYRNNSITGGVNTNRFNAADKNTSLFYQPVMDKEFDFIINPGILEPSVQILYQVQLTILRDKEKDKKPNKEYILVSPDGQFKTLPLQP